MVRYPVLLAVQACAMWRLWDKDLTAGDTLSYAPMASLWSHDLQVHFAWSPLYTTFYGQLRQLLRGPSVRHAARARNRAAADWRPGAMAERRGARDTVGMRGACAQRGGFGGDRACGRLRRVGVEAQARGRAHP